MQMGCSASRDDSLFARAIAWMHISRGTISPMMKNRKQTFIFASTGFTLLAMALGAAAVGAIAVGAVAMGALAIGKLGIRQGRIEKLAIGELTVDRLTIHEQIANDKK
jgi:hypothetical protein